MGVLEALLTNERISEQAITQAIQQAAAQVEISEFGDVDDGERYLDFDEVETLLQRLGAALGGLEVSQSDLDTIRTMHFDGGNEIYMLLEEQAGEAFEMSGDFDTGGESMIYNVNAFDGIESLTNLESLNLDGHGYSKVTRDVRPLSKLKSLTRVEQLGDRATHRETLSHLTHLS